MRSTLFPYTTLFRSILHRDRVELVVVAAGAGHSRRQKRLAQGIDLVVEKIVADLPKLDAIVVIDLAEAPEGGADQRLVDLVFFRSEEHTSELQSRGH